MEKDAKVLGGNRKGEDLSYITSKWQPCILKCSVFRSTHTPTQVDSHLIKPQTLSRVNPLNLRLSRISVYAPHAVTKACLTTFIQ